MRFLKNLFRKPKPQTRRPCVWVFLYAGRMHKVIAHSGDEALSILREKLSAKASREAILVQSYPLPEGD